MSKPETVTLVPSYGKYVEATYQGTVYAIWNVNPNGDNGAEHGTAVPYDAAVALCSLTPPFVRAIPLIGKDGSISSPFTAEDSKRIKDTINSADRISHRNLNLPATDAQNTGKALADLAADNALLRQELARLSEAQAALGKKDK